MPWKTALALVAVLLVVVYPARAQSDDDSISDHELSDRLYRQRHERDDRPKDPSVDSEAAIIDLADELIRDKNYRSASSERYQVQTDDPNLDPDAAVALLGTFREFFKQFWAGRIELLPYEDRSRVFLFYSFYKYNKLLDGDYRTNRIRPRGHYGGAFGAIAVHTGADNPAGLAETLVHEAAHQLVDRHMQWSAEGPATWLAEGLASYFGYLELDSSGKFLEGKAGAKRVNLYREGRRGKAPESGRMLQLVREALKKVGAEGSVYGDLLRIENPAEFYGENPLLHYAASWALIHFLLHAEEGRHARLLYDYIEREATGDVLPRDLLEWLDLDSRELDAAILRHTKQMK